MQFNNRALIVLGMHRSGTSALAGVLARLGADPGPTLQPAIDAINPKGYWEHIGIVEIHEQLLQTFGSSWSDLRPLPENWWRTAAAAEHKEKIIKVLARDFADSPLWVLKDPRLCRLVPMWLEIFDEVKCHPHFVISLRHPLEVAHSLRARDKFVEERSCMLWLEHVLEAERWSRDSPRVVVEYGNLLKDSRGEARRIAITLSLELSDDDSETFDQPSEFIDPSLRHHLIAEDMGAPRSIIALALRCHGLFLSSDLTRDVMAELDEVRREFETIQETVAPWAREIQRLEDEIFGLTGIQRQLDEAETEVKRVKNTLSWTITKPLRFTYNKWRRLAGWIL